MSIFTTEITSDRIPSDNPIHQRLLKAYFAAKPYVTGKLLELGCGEGRGINEIAPFADQYTAIDKIEQAVKKLRNLYPQFRFETSLFPPIPFPDKSFDTIVSFQVIEHIQKDDLFIKEMYRVLRPGGKALLTTPNIKMSLTRNPWHIREYTSAELESLCKKYFKKVDAKGIAGNQKVMRYHAENKVSVERITRFDILDLQHKLPSQLLRLPYEFMNRMNRKRLHVGNDGLVSSITKNDFFVNQTDETNLDLFFILTKD